MNTIDSIIKFYSHLHNYDFLPYWFLTPIRRVVRKVANTKFPTLLARQSVQAKKEIDVIVSFTSYPARIDNVWQVVECMFRQSLLPRKIILWLSKEQFDSIDLLPLSLKDRIGERFEVRLVEGDIKSHKKYYYVSKEFPDSLIFLIDDDIYYPSDMLKKTYEKYLSNPDSIIGNYGYEMTFDDNGNHKSYSEWNPIRGCYSGPNSFIGSGGGTLFKPSFMYEDFLDVEKACSLTPLADDIWINAMADMNNVRKYIINSGLVLDIHSINDAPLHKSNVARGGNDTQLRDIENYYKEFRLFERKK